MSTTSASVTVDRTFAAAPERVWRALTSADELAAWFWPRAWQAETAVDLRVGGSYRIASPTIGMAVGGEYVAVDPVTRLVQTWRWDGDDEEALVTIELEPVAEGTRLRILHERFADATAAADHEQGWSDCLDRLPTHLAAIAG